MVDFNFKIRGFMDPIQAVQPKALAIFTQFQSVLSVLQEIFSDLDSNWINLAKLLQLSAIESYVLDHWSKEI